MASSSYLFNVHLLSLSQTTKVPSYTLAALLWHPSVLQAAKKVTLQHLSLTHDSKKLNTYTEMYSNLMFNVAMGADFKQTLQLAASRLGLDLEQIVKKGYDDTSVSVEHGR